MGECDRAIHFEMSPPVRDKLASMSPANERLAADRFEELFELLIVRRGERYRNCCFRTFEIDTDPEISGRQNAVLHRVRDYANRIEEMIRDGRNLVLYGPVGTGKDHLQQAVLREMFVRQAIQSGRWSATWRHGLDLIEEMKESKRFCSESTFLSLLKRLVDPLILGISDPLPECESLAAADRRILGRIVDARYSANHPTIWTLNVASRKELEGRIGAQITDRILDRAVTCFCDWESFRRPRRDSFSFPAESYAEPPAGTLAQAAGVLHERSPPG